MSLKIASWKPLGSILDASVLDFGGPGPRFGRLRDQFFRDFRMFLAMYAENLPRICRSLAQLVDALLRSLSFCGLAPLGRDLSKWVGGGVPPPGGFNPPPTEGGAGRARQSAPSLSDTS